MPHISLVFREMWDTTTLNRECILGAEALGFSPVVSHISRKTSEMWGTRRHLVRNDPEFDSFVASGNLLTLAEGQTKGKEAAGKKAGERTLQ